MHILIKSLLSTSLAGDERPILTTFCMGNHAGGSWYFKHVFYVATEVYLCKETSL